MRTIRQLEAAMTHTGGPVQMKGPLPPLSLTQND